MITPGTGSAGPAIPLSEEVLMWRCTVCGYIYDEAKEGKKFEELPADWTCPVCNAPKDAFVKE